MDTTPPSEEEAKPEVSSDTPTGEYSPVQSSPAPDQSTIVQSLPVNEPASEEPTGQFEPPALSEEQTPAVEYMPPQEPAPVDWPARPETPSFEPPIESQSYPAPEPQAPAAYPLPPAPAPAKPFPLPQQPVQSYTYQPQPHIQQPAYPPVYAARPPKDRALALIAEVLPGMIGFLGIGWFYAGNMTVGLILLLGFLAWNFFAIILDVVTVGIFACLHVPLNLAAVIISPILLYQFTKKHPEQFGP